MIGAGDRITPVYILSGFLGSGKTTLLQRLLDYWKGHGLRPAVIMNEIGEVNLDGLLVREEVPMAELLNGCICCSIREDLGVEMAELIQAEAPDLIIIEATGAANPLEILDSVTETALYLRLDVKPLITVVDSAQLLELHRSQQGSTFRLMQEQIRAASILIQNKRDLISEDDVLELDSLLQRWNPFAVQLPAIRCQIDPAELLDLAAGTDSTTSIGYYGHSHGPDCGCNSQGLGKDGDQPHHAHSHNHGVHASHEHVMVYTHYFQKAINSERFEQLIRELPREIYRGKGVLQFSDTASRYLFQYAYRETDFLKITPQGEVQDVVVFIGEHFDKGLLAAQLQAIEDAS
ncbi:GTP-binding protein [Paenibacillus sp. CAA11]|uniref:CobW family GTP-binding protein n=1 Tax=Paenibacillus sp. CAA11 TaxID=1532905 RepID=UPI000D36045F|nr:GTP-binding protein [Paenibacillus sp. CAA11]AWB44394.1 GTP-binding protein [Paenibacillus sp. CAA11]